MYNRIYIQECRADWSREGARTDREGGPCVPYSSPQGWKKPGFFKKKPSPVGFLIFFGFFWVFWVFLGFFARTRGF